MKQYLVLPLVVAMAIGGCASNGEKGGDGEQSSSGEHNRAIAGAVVGGIVGGVLANNTGKRSRGKTAAGVVLGAAAGGAIGHSMDKKEKKLRKIAAERDAKAMEVERVSEDLLRVRVASEASFDVSRDDIKPEFKPTLNDVAGVLSDDPNLRIRIVGHTDSRGSTDYNQRLSERRARATADYLISRQVDASQIASEGRGESEPRADNMTAEGRAQNRRVEIYVQQM
jgi:outer membrane protein OmpA-like peptidoglycan-associated protein